MARTDRRAIPDRPPWMSGNGTLLRLVQNPDA